MPAIFTDRRGGSSLAPYESLNLALHVGDDPIAVARNRESLSHLVGQVQFMNQIHGDDFVIVNQLTDIDPTCDALITTTAGLGLAVLVADCIPLLLSSATVVAAEEIERPKASAVLGEYREGRGALLQVNTKRFTLSVHSMRT